METRKTKPYKIQENKPTFVEEPAVFYGHSIPILQNYTTNDDYSLIKKAKTGIKTDVFYSFADIINMPEKILAGIINLSPRTISNYRDQKKDLDANYSEHLLKLINLYHLGEDIFGSLEELNLWLQRPFWNSDEKPIDFLNTSGGVDLVSEEIEKLAQGYPL